MSKHLLELRTRTPGELQRLLGEAQEELITLRFGIANRQVTNVARKATLRREIARLKTLLREDQLRRTT